MDEQPEPLCRRLQQIRERHFGSRGRARFARALGVRPTTYHHYEIDRSPPADVLVRAASTTGTSLVWLLTGEGEMTDAGPSANSATGDETRVLFERMEKVLARRPDLTPSIGAFLDLLDDVSNTLPQSADDEAVLDTDDLIPVVGGTAAGTARFWKELQPSGSLGDDSNARLQTVLENHSARAVRQAGITPSGSDERDRVSLVQMSQPDQLGFVEFLSCRQAKAKHPRAVAWRIDGDSMSPRYGDGDLVIVSPDEPAVEGYPCVAHQLGQIGVNCKIFGTADDEILLVPLNEAYEPQRFPSDTLEWAYRVLYAVRLSGRE